MLPRVNSSPSLSENRISLVQIVVGSDIFRGFSKEKSDEQQIDVLELTISKVLITNTRTEPTSERTKLEQHLALIRQSSFFQQTQWPLSNTRAARISSLFEKHPYDTYLYNNPLSKKTGALAEPQSTSRALHTYYTMTTDSLKKVTMGCLKDFEYRDICSQRNLMSGIFI